MKQSEFRLKLFGEGGQGIKWMGHILSSILESLGKKISIILTYDSAVRGGDTAAQIVISDGKIGCPIVEEPDFDLNLKEGFFVSKNGERLKINDIFLEKKSLGKNIQLNTFSIGFLLKKLGVDLNSIDLKKHLPNFMLEENIESIKIGFSS